MKEICGQALYPAASSIDSKPLVTPIRDVTPLNTASNEFSTTITSKSDATPSTADIKPGTRQRGSVPTDWKQAGEICLLGAGNKLIFSAVPSMSEPMALFMRSLKEFERGKEHRASKTRGSALLLLGWTVQEYGGCEGSGMGEEEGARRPGRAYE
ncbi:hypothetical protein RRG08_000643 [Elysia crispata]|uniref:Uncharacterized protein n=1 Tax=Elysia crispata TaxID=231223 RepID=A0AAE1CU90_9GAST|nr:hypothetical protein RRG08_000643 [Elysia crispata]